MVPGVVLFLNFRTLCCQHMQSSKAESHMAIKVVLAGSVLGPMTEAISPPYGTNWLKCGGMNHYKKFCHTTFCSSSSKGQSPFKKGKQQHQDRRPSGKGKGKGPSNKGGGGGSTPYKKKQHVKTNKKAYSLTLKQNLVHSAPSGGETRQLSRKGKLETPNSFHDQLKKVCLTRLLVMQFIVNKVTHTMGVMQSRVRGCIRTLTLHLTHRSSQISK